MYKKLFIRHPYQAPNRVKLGGKAPQNRQLSEKIICNGLIILLSHPWVFKQLQGI